MRNRFQSLSLGLLLAAAIGCSKEKLASNSITPEANGQKVSYPTSPADKALVERIKGASAIVKKVLHNDDAAREMAAVIKGGYYTDERVTIGDLLAPGQSKAYQTEEYKKLKNTNRIREGSFAAEYAKYSPAIQLTSTSDSYSDIALYFPYSELFGLPADFTLVVGEVDANAWPGLVLNENEELPVLVDDDYAYAHPTIIVTGGLDIEIATPPNNLCDLNPAWCNDPLPPNPQLNLRRVQIGWARANENLDNLISFSKKNGGGNDVVWARTSGYLRRDSDGQITQFTNMIEEGFTRLEGRTMRWKPFYTTLDPNWRKEDTEQFFAVWEDDAKGCFELNGKLSTKVKAKILGAEVEQAGEIGFKHTICAEDNLVYQHEFEWNDYVGEARNQVPPHGWDLRPVNTGGIFAQVFGYGVFNFSSGTARDRAYLPNGESWPIVRMGRATSVTWPHQIVR